jgi:sigma-B regulation protein RsbU (phosphoserine phosphatase)
MIPAVFYHFTSLFLEKVSIPKRNVITVYIVSSAYLLFSLIVPSSFVDGLYKTPWFDYYPYGGTTYILFPILFSTVATVAIWALVKEFRISSSERKNQLKYLFTALIIGFAGGSTTFPMVLGINMYPFGTVGVSVYVLIVSYAISKHELLDIRIVLTKSLALIITSCITVFSTALLFVITKSLHNSLEFSLNIAGVLIISLLFSRIFETIYLPIAKRFLHETYDIQKILSDISTELIVAQDQFDVLKMMSHALQDTLETDDSIFIFSGLNDSEYNLYHDSFEKPLFSLKEDQELINYFQNNTEPILFESVPTDITKSLKPLRVTNHALCYPLESIQKFHGLLIIGEKLSGRRFTETDIQMIKTVLSQLMIVFDRIVYKEKIENLNKNLELKVEEQVKEIEEKRKIEVDLEIATDIQQLLLPERTPQITNYSFEALFMPAKSISGDYYDFFMFSKTKIGILLADVAGKGIPAALIMSNLKNMATQIVSEKKTPSQILTELNKIICNNRVFKKQIPVAYALLDTEKNTFAFCNAGHDAGKYYSNGKMSELESHGIPLGFYDDEVYEETTLELKKDDFITFYTDGISDARNKDNESYGDNRIDDIIKEYVKAPTECSFIERLEKDWLSFIGEQPLKDDTTLISIYHYPQDFNK